MSTSLEIATRRELALAADYMPPCPLCSVLQRQDQGPDVIHGPLLVSNQARTRWRIQHCCRLAMGAPPFASAPEAAAWWRSVRLEAPLSEMMTAKRARTLGRLARAGYEGKEEGGMMKAEGPICGSPLPPSSFIPRPSEAAPLTELFALE